MKMFLLAAAAVIAMPALAQTTPQSGTSTPDSATPATPADQTTPPADPSTTTPPSGGMQSMPPSTPADTANPAGTTTQDPMPAQTTATAPDAAPMGNAAGDPVGGYQPAAPALSGTPTAGVAPTFRAAPSPSEAYPAPAPLAHYPICKPGQFDNCMQGAGSTHSRQVHRRRR